LAYPKARLGAHRSLDYPCTALDWRIETGL